MITKFQGMDVSMKLMNERELFEKKFSENPFAFLCNDCGWKKEGSLGYNQILCPKCNSKHIIKESIAKEKAVKIIDEDKLAVYRFLCKKCLWSVSATMVGSPNKCGNCGSKDFLYSKLIITLDGENVEDAPEVKFNPDRNVFKESTLTHRERLQDKAERIDYRIKEMLKIIKLKESKK